MIDINLIRENPEKIKQNNQIRGCSVSVEEILELDKKRRELISKLDKMREERNRVSGSGKPSLEDIKKMKALKLKIKDIESDIKRIELDLNSLLVELPNITHESVPVGESEEENVVYKKWSPYGENGEIRDFGFKVKPHWEIGRLLDLIDEEKGSKVSGARFWYLKRELVYLEFAIIQYALEFLKAKGFLPMVAPAIVRERAMFGTGFFPADANEIYKIENPETGCEPKGDIDSKNDELLNHKGRIPKWSDRDQYLIGTAEVVLASYHADDILNLDSPLRYCGFSPCFRREAGTYGKDMKGILRGHQFDKVEMFVFAKEEDSWNEFEFLLSVAEEFWQSLKIPYRVMLMCSGDIGAPNAKKYDIEAFLPGQGEYREVVSCSNDTDFQSRRLNIAYRDKKGKKHYAHTLNSTLVAIGRCLIAIMENYQTEHGTIIIPEILRKYYIGGDYEIKRS